MLQDNSSATDVGCFHGDATQHERTCHTASNRGPARAHALVCVGCGMYREGGGGGDNKARVDHAAVPGSHSAKVKAREGSLTLLTLVALADPGDQHDTTTNGEGIATHRKHVWAMAHQQPQTS